MSQTNDLDNMPTVTARRSTPEEDFWDEWGLETFKQNMGLLNEVLRTLLALSGSLVGGSVVFLDDKRVSQPFWGLAVGAFLVALIVSLLGVLPYEGRVNLLVTEEIKQHKQRALSLKNTYARLAGGALVIGLVVALLGMLVKT